MTSPPNSEFNALRIPEGKRGPAKIYHVPRRFNLPSVFVMTTLLAVVCAILRASDALLEVYLFFAVMTVVTCAAQIYAPKRPRLASTLGGGFGFVVFAAVAYLLNPPRRGPEWGGLFCASFFFFIIGAFGGYLFGTLAASVFLITDRVFRRTPEE